MVEARIVFHLGGQGQLPAGMHALDQQGRKVRPCRVDGGGQPRRPGPDNDDVPHGRNLTQRLEQCTGVLLSEVQVGGAERDPGGAEWPTAESAGLRRRKAMSTSGWLGDRTRASGQACKVLVDVLDFLPKMLQRERPVDDVVRRLDL